jgi:hypothetical protein
MSYPTTRDFFFLVFFFFFCHRLASFSMLLGNNFLQFIFNYQMRYLQTNEANLHPILCDFFFFFPLSIKQNVLFTKHI